MRRYSEPLVDLVTMLSDRRLPILNHSWRGDSLSIRGVAIAVLLMVCGCMPPQPTPTATRNPHRALITRSNRSTQGLGETRTVIPSNRRARAALTQRGSIPSVATQPAPPPDIPKASFAEPSPQREAPSPPRVESGRRREDITSLRDTFLAHATDKDWIIAWLAQKLDFSGRGIFVGATQDQAGSGAAGGLRTDGFASTAGMFACINPDDAPTLKVGDKVNIHGVVTIFIENVMYLEQCSIQPG